MKGCRSVRQQCEIFLAHRSGLPGWRPLYERLEARGIVPALSGGTQPVKQHVLHMIRDEPLIYARGERSRLQRPWIHVARISGGTSQWNGAGSLVRRSHHPTATGRSNDVLPYGRASATSVARPTVDASRIAPTEQDEWRNRLLRGEVHDENAAAMGGVAGHAGLFGTAESVLAVSGAWLRGYNGRGRFWMGSLSGSLQRAKNRPLDRVGRWDGILRPRRPHRGPVFPSGHSGISATLGLRCGLIRCANWRWCCYPTGYIRAGGTRRSRSSARSFTTWYIVSLCLQDSQRRHYEGSW